MSPFRNSNLLSLAMGHFIVDFFSGALPIVVAALTAPLELTVGQVGLIALAYSLATSLAQPLFGLIADSRYAPYLALGGVIWQVGMMGIAGLATSFEMLLVMVAIGGLGSAAFHPPGAGGVPRVSTRDQRASSMSIFLLGGNSGYAIGPLIAGQALARLGAKGTLILLAGAAVLIPMLAIRLLRIQYQDHHEAAPAAHTLQRTKPLRRSIPVMAIVLLALAITFRGWASQGMNNYLPQYFLLMGTDVALAGQALTLLNVGAAIGGFTSGVASDRIGAHKVIVATLLMAAPLMLAFRFVSGPLMLVVIGGMGTFLLASLPLTLVLGQDMLPGRPGVMSGLTLGFTFITGGLGAAIIGAVAERIGLEQVFTWMPVLPLFGGLAALALMVHQARTSPKVQVLSETVRSGQ